jgi:hypothetical protein
MGRGGFHRELSRDERIIDNAVNGTIVMAQFQEVVARERPQVFAYVERGNPRIFWGAPISLAI